MPIAEKRRRIWQNGSDTSFGRRRPIPEVALSKPQARSVEMLRVNRKAGADG